MDRKIYGRVWLIENYKACYELSSGLKVEIDAIFYLAGE